MQRTLHLFIFIFYFVYTNGSGSILFSSTGMNLMHYQIRK